MKRRLSVTNLSSENNLLTFALMTTGALSRNVGKLFSELKLVTDNPSGHFQVHFRDNTVDVTRDVWDISKYMYITGYFRDNTADVTGDVWDISKYISGTILRMLPGTYGTFPSTLQGISGTILRMLPGTYGTFPSTLQGNQVS